jgi:hypothetical protein
MLLVRAPYPGILVGFLALSLVSTAEPLRLSFLMDESARRDTLTLLKQHGFRAGNIRRFSQEVERYYASPFVLDRTRFPAPEDGFYHLESVEELVGLFDKPLCETEHAFEFNCFDAVIALAMPQLESRIKVDQLMGPILVPHTTTNGTALTLPVATARDAFNQAYPEWYREFSANIFPTSLECGRVALTAALNRVHVLRISTDEANLQPAVREALQRDWRDHRLRFPSNAQIVLCHLVYFPGRWLRTSHAGVLMQNGQGYTYIEKAGGAGPFVRIDVPERAELMPWFAATFRKARAEGHTHLFVTFNDAEIKAQRLTQ